jgi:site-specific recombinase XerD
MGAIRQLKNGKFQITVYDTTGRRHRMRFEKHKFAKAYIDKIENEKSEQKLIDAGLIKKTSFVDHSITEFILTKVDLREKSKKKYKRVLEQFRIFCSNEVIINMNDFSRDHADKFWSAITDSGAAAKTANFYLMVTRALFEIEIHRDRLTKNPLSHIKPLKENVKSLIEREDEYYNEEEIKAFFIVDMDEFDKDVFRVLFLTGLRISEMESLQWDRSIDMTNKLIKVRSFGDYKTKNATSERDIPMTDTVYNILQKMFAGDNQGYVFKNGNGEVVKERSLLVRCKVIAEKAGIKKNATVHMWRHSFSSHVLNTDIQYEEKQYLMGHKPESMTDRYTKINPTSLHKKLTQLDELIK